MNEERQQKRITLNIDKDVYDALEDKGVLKRREASKLINALLRDWLNTEELDNLTKTQKNFISNAVSAAMEESMSEQKTRLQHIYQAIIFGVYTSIFTGDLTNSEIKSIRNNTIKEVNRMLRGFSYEENFLAEDFAQMFPDSDDEEPNDNKNDDTQAEREDLVEKTNIEENQEDSPETIKDLANFINSYEER